MYLTRLGPLKVPDSPSMPVVNKSSNQQSARQVTKTANSSISIISNSVSTAADMNLEGLKRKFQRVNQEIVKQNVSLQEQLARNRQEQHLVLQENVRLKGRVVALESKVKEAEGVALDTKKSIGDRIEILEVIGEHLIEVTKFLKLLSLDENGQVIRTAEEQENPPHVGFDENFCIDSVKNLPPGRKQATRAMMQSIAEEEDLLDLTDHIEDVSLIENEKDSNKRKKK